MCFWAAIFLVAYGAGLLLISAWPVFQPYTTTLILAAMGIACAVNFLRNRTLHCALTAPLFLIAAVVAALVEAGIWQLNLGALWGVVLAGVGVALLIEWRTVGQQAS